MNEAVRLSFEPFLGWPLFWGLAGLTALAWVAYLALRGRAWLRGRSKRRCPWPRCLRGCAAAPSPAH